MTKSNYLYLEDIKDAIGWIVDVYTKDMDYYEFINDNKTQDAVVRQILIIGEAMNNITDEFVEKHKVLPAREAISMRNLLVHEYDMVDVDRLWNTIIKDLPKLLTSVESIISNQSDSNR